jgi:arylsulfatase A-like enzyme
MLAGFALIFTLSAIEPCLAVKSKPNIILILTDDQGYGDIGRHGNPILKTPNMDRLYDESVRFTDFQVSPCCAPTRCALMTGMHEFKSGVTHTILPYRQMNPKSTTVAEVLKSAGYATGLFGKWHLGQDPEHRPDHRGFDVGLCSVSDTQRSHFNPVLVRNGVKEQHKGFRTDIFFSEAIKFIEENKTKNRPFFCYIPTYSPHAPHKVPEEYAAPYKHTSVSNFYGMIANIDKNIGLLLRKLKALELDSSTLIVFINDNGGTVGVDNFNAGMRGCKGTPWYGGTRAFSFWRWPGTLKPRAIDHLTAHYDVLPTLADVTGMSLSEEHRKELDGISLYPLLKDRHATWPKERMLFTNVARWGKVDPDEHMNYFAAVRYRRYHLVNSHYCDNRKCKHQKCQMAKQVEKGTAKAGYSPAKAQFHFALTPKGKWSLFNLAEDPSQSHDMADQRPELVKKMAEQYDAWWKQVRPMMTHDQKEPDAQ